MGMKREFPLDSPKHGGSEKLAERRGGTRRFAGTPQVTILDGGMGDEPTMIDAAVPVLLDEDLDY